MPRTWRQLSANLSYARRRSDRMKLREFIRLLGSAAAVWPLAARANTRRCRLVNFLLLADRKMH
jgi:hypothetical protein